MTNRKLINDKGSSRLTFSVLQCELCLQGGEDAPKGRFPYIGSLKNDINQHLCGAVLINERFALTGGHCVHPNYQLSAKLNAHITIGLYDSTDDGDAAGIEV